MKRPERAIQRAILTLLWRTYPQAFAMHIPLGGYRNKIEAYNLKLDGCLAGCPDLIVIRPNGRVGWIEVKADTAVSKVQAALHAKMLPMGHTVHVIDDVLSLMPIIEQWKREDAATRIPMPGRPIHL